jgi:hypothetical protein
MTISCSKNDDTPERLHYVICTFTLDIPRPIPFLHLRIEGDQRIHPLFHGEVYSIQHYVLMFVSDLWPVDGVLRVLRFPASIKLTATI